MILEEQNQIQERKKTTSLLKSIIKNLLPCDYRVTIPDHSHSSCYVNIERRYFLGWTIVGEVKFKDVETPAGPIVINFEEEQEYNRLKHIFDRAKEQFIISIDDTDYY